MASIYEKELAVAKDIAKQAGVIMKDYFFRDDLGIEKKEDNTVVTVADKKINHLVIEELAKHFDDGVIGEEESNAGYGMGRLWFCDPIDGTAGFIWGTPTAMFSLALIVDGIPALGVAYDPFLDLMYFGVKGEGSYCNGKRLQVSKIGFSGGYVVLTSSVAQLVRAPDLAKKILEQKARLATFSGSVYKVCLIARGKFVAFVENGLHHHDTAAVEVILEEAGGKITYADGGARDYSKPFIPGTITVASNGVVHDQLLRMISS